MTVIESRRDGNVGAWEEVEGIVWLGECAIWRRSLAVMGRSMMIVMIVMWMVMRVRVRVRMMRKLEMMVKPGQAEKSSNAGRSEVPRPALPGLRDGRNG